MQYLITPLLEVLNPTNTVSRNRLLSFAIGNVEAEIYNCLIAKHIYYNNQGKPNRKPIRTYRLGDGYFLEHLAYRIEHKNFEMPLSEIAKYDGIQREYAICLRQIQIMLYKAPETDRPHYVSSEWKVRI